MRHLFIIFWLIANTSVSQTFNNSYFGNVLAIGGGTSQYVIGDTLFSVSYHQGNFRASHFRSYDRNGQNIDSNLVIWSNPQMSSIAHRLYCLTYNKSNGLFYAALDMYFSGVGVALKLVALDKSFDTIKSRDWSMPDFPLVSTYDVIADDSTITVVGHYGNLTGKLNLFIAQFDTAFNLLWYNTVADFRGGPPNLFNGYYPYRFQKTADAYYVVGRCFYPNVMVEGFVVKTDLQGNKIWDKRYRYQNKHIVISDLIVFEDSLIFGASYLVAETGPKANFTQFVFASMDTSGNILHEWPENIDGYNRQLTSMIFSRDSGFVVTGYQYHRNMYAAYGLISKFSKDLSTLWRRTYYHGHVTNDENFLHRVAEWSDGGLIASGTHYREFSPQNEFVHLWLLSTDSNGCLDANNCGHNINLVEFEKSNHEQLRVYPNPTRGSIALELPINFSEAAQVRLINPSGQLALETTVFFELGKAQAQLGNLPTGIYTLVLHTKQEVFHLKISVL